LQSRWTTVLTEDPALLFRLGLLFVLVFLLNVVPAFAPPTWIAVSLFGLRYPDASPLALAVVSAPAATAGRIALAKLSTRLVRNRFLTEKTRANIDVIRRWLERRVAMTAAGTLVFAFSPLPSNCLFIAYGLTSLRLRYIAAPFAIGRFVSYAGWSWAAQSLAERLSAQHPRSFFDGYFVLGQVVGLLLLIAFARLDWATLLEERKVRILRRPAPTAS
jgi:hypothetical protein